MRAPHYLVTEAATEARLADREGRPVMSLQDLLTAAETEVLLLVAEIDAPTPTSTAERRVNAVWLVAQLLRARQAFEDAAL